MTETELLLTQKTGDIDVDVEVWLRRFEDPRTPAQQDADARYDDERQQESELRQGLHW